MLVYLAMFALPATSTLFLGTRRTGEAGRLSPAFLLILLIFTILVGFRYQIGTDWFNYQRTIDSLYYANFTGALASKDIGFGILVWIANRLGAGMYITNVVCGAIMMYGIARFAHAQPDRWMALTAAVPYLIIVVGMGYTRQAAAIGFVLLAIIAFERGQAGWTIGHVIMGALFHGSSLCVLPFFAAAMLWNNKRLILPCAVVITVLYITIFSRRFENLYGLYVTREEAKDSSGALIRLMMNVVPSLIFLGMRSRFVLSDSSRILWTLFALCSVGLCVLLPIFPSSTALDRVALYMIPIQLFVFGRLPLVFGQSLGGARVVSYVASLYYGLTLMVWLKFASNAHNWLPYKLSFLS